MAVQITTVQKVGKNLPVCVDNPLFHATEICPICWEPICKFVPLPCNHKFHPICISSWFERQANCPMCRMTFCFVPPPPPPPRETEPPSVPVHPSSPPLMEALEPPPDESSAPPIQSGCCFWRVWRRREPVTPV